jgi:hypothetical protein
MKVEGGLFEGRGNIGGRRTKKGNGGKYNQSI